jgi:hypothetical protein
VSATVIVGYGVELLFGSIHVTAASSPFPAAMFEVNVAETVVPELA